MQKYRRYPKDLHPTDSCDVLIEERRTPARLQMLSLLYCRKAKCVMSESSAGNGASQVQTAKFIAKEPRPRCAVRPTLFAKNMSLWKKSRQISKGKVMALIYDFEPDIAGANLTRSKTNCARCLETICRKPQQKSDFHLTA
jgi:hypothetical protein